MNNLNCLSIIKKYLTENGFDGLQNAGECGCRIDNLIPCGDDFLFCTAGYAVQSPPQCEFDFYICQNKNDTPWDDQKYEDQGEVVIDHATGLMWQKAGSDNAMKFNEVQGYINGLNSKSFAGYSGWMLPTIDELMSLMEPERKPNGFHIDPVFDTRQGAYWSSGTVTGSPGWAWLSYFYHGVVSSHYGNNYVRAVRSVCVGGNNE